MCPDRGVLSPAMRNRAVEIYLTSEEMFVNSTPDKIRLIGGPELELSLAPYAATEHVERLFNHPTAYLLKLGSFTTESKRRIFQLPISQPANYAQFTDIDSIREFLQPSTQNIASSIADYLDDFYENGWLYFSQNNDPPVSFFYARVASRMCREKALFIALSDKCNFPRLRNLF